MSGSDLGRVEALTFDCYGTLIDWDGGAASAFAELESLRGADLEAIVRDRELAEREIEAGAYRPYSEVLAESLRRAGERHGYAVSDADCVRFARSITRWPPFEESRAMLERLAARYRLVILSNIENALLAESVALLGAEFEHLVTAEDVRSYKPRAAHFEEGLRRLDLGTSAVLHVAASPYHDVAPARALGWRVAWINRTGSALPAGIPEPSLELPDLTALVARLGA